jgi:hypothetical protein
MELDVAQVVTQDTCPPWKWEMNNRITTQKGKVSRRTDNRPQSQTTAAPFREQHRCVSTPLDFLGILFQRH